MECAAEVVISCAHPFSQHLFEWYNLQRGDLGVVSVTHSSPTQNSPIPVFQHHMHGGSCCAHGAHSQHGHGAVSSLSLPEDMSETMSCSVGDDHHHHHHHNHHHPGDEERRGLFNLGEVVLCPASDDCQYLVHLRTDCVCVATHLSQGPRCHQQWTWSLEIPPPYSWTRFADPVCQHDLEWSDFPSPPPQLLRLWLIVVFLFLCSLIGGRSMPCEMAPFQEVRSTR